MDYPDTDEMNFAKDARDLNEYCSTHELPYQDLDHQGMMTEEQDRLENPDNSKENVQRPGYQDENNSMKESRKAHVKATEEKLKSSVESNRPDTRETPSGFI
jgi:hypothetical protein